ncbi:MAG: 2-amino-4-hydroxy-6-hydroxymethyldihydropteridine diphosphokinase [Terriglobia bacterium]
MKRIYLCLGSNQGDRLAHLGRAAQGLEAAGVRVLRLSSYYKTQPVDFIVQAWFVNCVAEAATDLLPLRLLRACKEVEWAGGRRPGVPKGPRPIDIDILLYENAVIHSRELVVPHPRMAGRRFVLVPLCEIAPGLRLPGLQRTIAEMLQETPDLSQVVRMKTRDK